VSLNKFNAVFLQHLIQIGLDPNADMWIEKFKKM